MTSSPRPWTYRKTYVDTSPFLEIRDANDKLIACMTLWPEHVEENAKLICKAVNAEEPREDEEALEEGYHIGGKP